MNESVVSKDNFVTEKDAALSNNSYKLKNKDLQSKKDAKNLKKVEVEESNNTSYKSVEDNSVSNKKILEQIERRKLLEEYKRKKQEKKNSIQKGISSKVNLKNATTKIKHEIISSYSKNKVTNQPSFDKLKKVINSKKSIEIKNELNNKEKKATNKISNDKPIRKTKSIDNLKTIKKDDIHNKLNSTVIFEKPTLIENKNDRNDVDLKQSSNLNLKSKTQSNVSIKNKDIYKESKSFISLRQPKLEYDKELKANTTVVLPSSNTSKRKEKEISLDIPILKDSSLHQPFPKPSDNETFKLKETKFDKKLLSLPKKSKFSISRSKSSLSYSPSTPKLKSKILNSPLMSSPTSSPTSVSNSKVKTPTKISNSSHSNIKSGFSRSPSITSNITSLPKSKKSGNIIHSPTKLSIKSSTSIKANQSFSESNISNKRNRPLSSNINKSFINYERNIFKKIKLNQDLSIHNKDNKIIDKKILSDTKEEFNTKSEISKEGDTNILKANNKIEMLKDIHLIKLKNSDEKTDIKKNSSCPHYLMPTANWKTKTVKTINEKKNSSKLSPIVKSKVALKVLNSSKVIKKKLNNTKNHSLLTSMTSNNMSHIINNSNTINITHSNNNTSNNTKTPNNNINTIISKPNVHHLYTHKSSIPNVNDVTTTTSTTTNKLSTPTITRSKSISNNSSKAIKGCKKERTHGHGVISRSSTLPTPTPSKRINKNIKRNNVAFTEENEQDINRMFISAETLKSTSIDSFFTHYSNTEVDTDKKSNHSVKGFHKKSLNNTFKKLEKKNDSNLDTINELVNPKDIGNKNSEKKISNSISEKNDQSKLADDKCISEIDINDNVNKKGKNDQGDGNEKNDDTKLKSNNIQSLDIINQEISSKDVPKENLLIENNQNDKSILKKIEPKNVLKESNLNNTQADFFMETNHELLGTTSNLNTYPTIIKTNSLINMDDTKTKDKIKVESLNKIANVQKSQTNNNSFDEDTKCTNVNENTEKNNHLNELKLLNIKNEEEEGRKQQTNEEVINLKLLDQSIINNNKNMIEQIDQFVFTGKGNTIKHSANTSFVVNNSKIINSDEPTDITDKIDLNKHLNNTSFNSLDEKDIEEMSSIEEKDFHDIKDLSFKIKNIESLVEGTTVKVNKIIEDYQDDSFIVDDAKEHRLNASFTVSNLSNIDKSMVEIKNNQQRPYHSFIIDNNNHSFISRLANTSQFIEEEKSNSLNPNNHPEYDPTENILKDLDKDKEFVEHCSLILSKKEGKRKKTNTTSSNSPENKQHKLTNITTPSSKNRRSSLISSHSPMSSSKKKKNRKRNIYKNEIIRTPTADANYHESPNHLPIVGGDVNGKGSSIMVLTPIRAKKKDREEFGVTSVVTPVRRSLRNIQKKLTGSSSHKKNKKVFSLKYVKDDPDTPIPSKYLHSNNTNNNIHTSHDFNDVSKPKIKDEKEDEVFLDSDYEELFKPSNKFEAIEEILEKHDYAFIPNKAINIENFDFPNEISYTPKKEIKIEENEED